MSGEGKGGAAGFAKGGAAVRMEAAGGGTKLTYDAEAQVGGKLAQLGSRIIDAFTRRLADQFFSNFQEVVEARAGGAAPETPSEPVKAPETVANTAAEPEKKGWLKRIFG